MDNQTPSSPRAALDRLLGVTDRLLDPETGCPWDRKQTPETISGYILEETHELIEAVESGSAADVCEELGDCLFLLCFLTKLFQQKGDFDLSQVIKTSTDKMVARHPHIFTDAGSLENAEQVRAQWHQIKRREKKERSILDGAPKSLPSLARAHRLTERAGKTGFDWQGPDEIWASLEEEIGELKKATTENRQSEIEHEMGDVLFVMANLSRHLKVNAEQSLRRTNDRFTHRFQYIEAQLTAQGTTPDDASLEEMDRLWDEAKLLEKKKEKTGGNPS